MAERPFKIAIYAEQWHLSVAPPSGTEEEKNFHHEGHSLREIFGSLFPLILAVPRYFTGRRARRKIFRAKAQRPQRKTFK
jgi:hypothetical protein